MALEQNLVLRSDPCGATSLADKQYYAVTYGNDGLLVVSTAAKNMSGILQNKPVAGAAGVYAVDGISPAAIAASQTLSIGDYLEIGSGGTLVAAASGTKVARCREALASVAHVMVISVEILRSNATIS